MKIITILTAAALGLTATASLAQQSTTVSYADLDIDSAAGMAVLAHRINHAADKVCDRPTGVTSLADHMAAQACRTAAIANAMKAFEVKTAPRYAAR